MSQQRRPPAEWIAISLPRQRLEIRAGSRSVRSWPVSTAAAGAGERHGSGATPRGWHTIRAMIGAKAPSGSVFVARRPTGEIYSAALAAAYPRRDWILTRILWLCGSEPGFNRGGAVDSQRRFIYLHGTPETEPMGIPCSHGCIRLHSAEMIALFDVCRPGMAVWIGAED